MLQLATTTTAHPRDAYYKEVVALRDRCAELEEELRQLRARKFDEVPFFPARWHLTGKETTLLSLLYRQPQVLSKQRIMSELYDLSDDEPMEKIVDVFICKLRRKLGADVLIETRRGQGYWLPPAQRVRLRAFIDAEETGVPHQLPAQDLPVLVVKTTVKSLARSNVVALPTGRPTRTMHQKADARDQAHAILAGRRALGLSQNDLSRLTGIPQAAISLFERVGKNCSTQRVAKMAQALVDERARRRDLRTGKIASAPVVCD